MNLSYTNTKFSSTNVVHCAFIFFHLIIDVYYIFLRWVNCGYRFTYLYNLQVRILFSPISGCLFGLISIMIRHVWLPTWENGNNFHGIYYMNGNPGLFPGFLYFIKEMWWNIIINLFFVNPNIIIICGVEIW